MIQDKTDIVYNSVKQGVVPAKFSAIPVRFYVNGTVNTFRAFPEKRMTRIPLAQILLRLLAMVQAAGGM
jgi:hypothetical protein